MEINGLQPNLFNAQPFAQNPNANGLHEQDSSAKKADPARRVNGVNKGSETTKGAGGDKVSLSGEAIKAGQAGAGKSKETDPSEKRQTEAQVAKLKAREQEVIAHEAAHSAAGGQYAGSASYSYTTGPDGKQYISGGEVSIRTPSGSTPEETARIARQVRAAALAPAKPSAQDMSVAASASQREAAAQREIASAKSEEALGGDKEVTASEVGQKGPLPDNTTNGAEKTIGINGSTIGLAGNENRELPPIGGKKDDAQTAQIGGLGKSDRNHAVDIFKEAAGVGNEDSRPSLGGGPDAGTKGASDLIKSISLFA